MYQKVAGVEIEKFLPLNSIQKIYSTIISNPKKSEVEVGAIIFDKLTDDFFIDPNIPMKNIWLQYVCTKNLESKRFNELSEINIDSNLHSTCRINGVAWYFCLYGMVLYDEIPDFILDTYNNLKDKNIKSSGLDGTFKTKKNH